MRIPFRRDPSATRLASPDDTMTLVEHLAELRTRIIRSLGAVVLGVIIILAAYDWVLTEKIRAGYLGSKDPADSAARMKAAGQNTVVLKLGSLGQPPLTNELAVLTAWAEKMLAA